MISAVLESTIEEIETALTDRVDIKIRGLGTFRVDERKRKLRNFSLGVSEVRESRTIKFFPSKNIRDAVKGDENG